MTQTYLAFQVYIHLQNYLGQFYGMLTVILPGHDLNSHKGSECQFFVESVNAVASEVQHRCLVLEDDQ